MLLPEVALEGIILDEFKTSSLKNISIKTLFRFIARLQCTWWLPYLSIAKDIEVIIRNFEDSLIDEDKFFDTLNLFNKSPDDFGYQITVSDEDLVLWKKF